MPALAYQSGRLKRADHLANFIQFQQPRTLGNQQANRELNRCNGFGELEALDLFE